MNTFGLKKISGRLTDVIILCLFLTLLTEPSVTSAQQSVFELSVWEERSEAEDAAALDASGSEEQSPSDEASSRLPNQRLVSTDSTQSQPLVSSAAESSKPTKNGSQAEPARNQDEVKKKQAELKKQVAGAHKGVYYLNDFSYVLDPAYHGWQLGNGLKRRRLFHHGFYDIGGEYRLRQHSEHRMRGFGLTGVNDDFLLRRARLYGNFEFTKNLRVFGEMIDARSDFENFTPRGIEVNHYDMLNLFVDGKLWSEGDRSLTTRLGRQELLLGDQRLVSPLDWANTRRTFDGYRFTAKSKDFSLDGFYTNPVIVNQTGWDTPDLRQEFMGLYSSYTGFEDEVLDFYVLRYNNASGVNDFDFNTFGTRLKGNLDDLLYDAEVMYQSGRNTDGSAHNASSYTAGLGHKLNSQSQANPILWQYFDWASGDDAQGAGNGFHHLFPLAHRYNGFMDLFGRRNLGDVNTLLTFTPSKKLSILVWYHYFFLTNGNDTPYDIRMLAFNPANAPASRDLGHELDLLSTYAISPRQQLQLGYSHFWAGNYFRDTAGVPTRRDADFLYTQWSLAF